MGAAQAGDMPQGRTCASRAPAWLCRGRYELLALVDGIPALRSGGEDVLGLGIGIASMSLIVVTREVGTTFVEESHVVSLPKPMFLT